MLVFNLFQRTKVDLPCHRPLNFLICTREQITLRPDSYPSILQETGEAMKIPCE